MRTESAWTGTRNAGVLRGDPLRAVGGEAAGRDDQMDVRMIEQRACPGGQHRDALEWGADEPRVGGERLEGGTRAPHQRATDEALMVEGEGAQRWWHRDGDQIVRTG